MASGIRLPWATRLPVSTWAGLKALAEMLGIGQGDVVTILVERALTDLDVPPELVGKHTDRIVSGEVSMDGPARVKEARTNLATLRSGVDPMDRARDLLDGDGRRGAAKPATKKGAR